MPETQLPPLAGIKVVDLTRYLAGPFCTQILGDYGAEILKIEPVENPRGELGDGKGPDTYFFLSTNRSKKSIRLAIKKPEGREILMRLIDGADVVVDNFRPGVMQAIGLDYETLAPRNPRIITCSISGFGSTGPLRDFPGFDQIAQGMSGSDERDRHRRERADPRRHRDLRSARRNFLGARESCSRSKHAIATAAASGSRPRCSNRSSAS